MFYNFPNTLFTQINSHYIYREAMYMSRFWGHRISPIVPVTLDSHRW